MNRIGRVELLLLCAIVIFTAGFRLAVLNRPFHRDQEGCGAFYGLVARNYFRYDLSQSVGVPIISMGKDAPPVIYGNHPVTTPLMIVALHWLSGYRGGYDDLPGEWQTRLPASMFTVGCVILVYVIIRRRGNAQAALLAAGLFAAIPMTLYYGGQPDVINTQLVFFALLTIAAYERFSDQPSGKTFGLLALAFLGAAIMDWPAFFLVPLLGLHYICTHRPKQWMWIIGFGLVSTVIFAGLYSHLAIGQDDWNWMASEVERRTGGQTDGGDSITLRKWLYKAEWNLRSRHTLVLTALAPVWLVLAAQRRFRGPADRFAALLAGWAAMHLLVGKQGVYQHEWWWWPATAAVVVAAALAIDELVSMIVRRGVLPARGAAIALATAVLLFTGLNSISILRELAAPAQIDSDAYGYPIRELGTTIRQNVPPDRAVLVAESDYSLGLWYYADRALKRHVWDVQAFEKRLRDEVIDLSFDASGPYSRPAAAMVVPRSYLKDLAPLTAYLDARYPGRDAGHFRLYDLTAPRN